MHGRRLRVPFSIAFAVFIAIAFLVVDGSSSVSADTVVTISGRAVYENSNENTFGVYGAKVLICDDDGLFGRQCVETTTDSNGDYSATLIDTFEDDDDVEVYVEIIAEAPRVAITSGDLLNPFAYCYRTGMAVVEDGGSRDFGEQRPLSNNTCSPISVPHTDERENAAFYVFDRLYRAWEYMSGITQMVNGSTVPKVTASLVASNEDGENDDVSFYSFNAMTLQPYTWEVGSTRGMETIYHEYGHHLLRHFAESPVPDYINGNCDDVDPFLIFEIPDPGHCRWLAEKDVIAWTEGFPTFLAAVFAIEVLGTNAIQENAYSPVIEGTRYYYEGTEFPAMEVVNTQDGVIYTLGDSQGIVEGHPDSDFEHVEGWTTAALWDLYDNVVDDHDQDGTRDTVSMSFQDIWTVVTTYDPAPTDSNYNHPLSIAEFYEGVRSLFGNTVTAARLAGPFIENHFDVPAAALDLDSLGTYQDWNSNDKFGRGDTLSAHYKVCRPSDSEVDWGGEGQVGIVLLHPTTGGRLFTAPPLTMPDVEAGQCASGVYEFTVPEDMELFGPRYIGGTMTDNHAVFDAVVCADPHRLLAEMNEENNCESPHTLRLQNNPPILVSNAPPGGFVVNEGSDLIIDFTGSYDPDPILGQGLEYKVASSGTDFDTGIGFVSDQVITFTPGDAAELADGTEPGTVHSILLRIRDDGSPEFSSEAIFATSVTVNNVAPQTFFTNVPAGGQFIALEGTPVQITGQFFDPGADSWEVFVWADGETDVVPEPITNVDFSTSIVPNGYFGSFEIAKSFPNQTGAKGAEVYACVTDDDGGEGCTPIGQMQVVVYNVAPTVTVPATLEANDIGEVVIEGSFTDPGDDPWVGTVDVDGQGEEPITLADDKTFSVDLSFTQVGIHPVDICITDDLVTTCETVLVEVINVAPDFDLVEPAPLSEGDTVVITGTFIDPGQDTWTATVAFDEATPEPLPLDGFDFTVEREYPQDGTFSIEVCISDGFSTTCRSTGVTVVNVAPVFELGGPSVINESEAIDVAGAFTDPGADDWTATIAFGGGSAQPLNLTGFDFSFDRTYDQDGSYLVEVCISDDDTIVCDTLQVTVLNVIPVVTLGDFSSNVITLVETGLTATYEDPGTEDAHEATVNWGDGTVDTLPILPDSLATGAVAAQHTYEMGGQYIVTICVSDDDDAGCMSGVIEVLEPADALDSIIDELQLLVGSNTDVAAALKEIDGPNERAASGAIDRLMAGTYIAALTKMSKAINALDQSDGDHSDAQWVIAAVGESIARDLLAQAEDLGLSDSGSLANLDEMRSLIEAGSAALEFGQFAESLQAFKSAVQIGISLL